MTIKHAKITLSTDDLWIIRSVKTSPAGQQRTVYYESPGVWNTAPTHATIFTSYEAAWSAFVLYDERDKAKKGWADGSKEELDVVSLYTEIIHSPNARIVGLKGSGGSSDGEDA